MKSDGITSITVGAKYSALNCRFDELGIEIPFRSRQLPPTRESGAAVRIS